MSLESFLSLPLEQQIGQFFYIGLAGTEIDAETRALIEEVKPGGVIIFGRNVESALQLRKLLDDVRELLPTDRFSESIRKAGWLIGCEKSLLPCLPREPFESTAIWPARARLAELPVKYYDCWVSILTSRR